MTDPKTSINGLIKQVQGLSDDQLEQSLKTYLREGSFGELPIYTHLERHRFVAELFNNCDLVLQERLRTVFPKLLESFEATNPQDSPQYLFYLISLASVIRNSQTKERLRRWLRHGTFERWKYDIFDLSSELLVATSAYDSDEDWTNFILNVLPRRSTFRAGALAAYRALWQTKGLTCLSLLPNILVVADLEDEAFSKSLGYLLRLTIDKAGVERVCRTGITVLEKMDKPVHEVWTIVLRLDEMIDRELLMYKDGLNPLIEYLKVVWDKAVDRWIGLAPEEMYEAFDRLLDVPEKDWQSIDAISPWVRGAFKFRNKYMLEVADEHIYVLDRCGMFFDEINSEREEVAYTTVGVGAASM